MAHAWDDPGGPWRCRPQRQRCSRRGWPSSEACRPLLFRVGARVTASLLTQHMMLNFRLAFTFVIL